MPFDKSKWAIDGSHANKNIPRIHSYSTTDLASVVDTSGYFDSINTELSVGDLIQAYVDTGGTPQMGFFLVSSIVAGVVDCNNIGVLPLPGAEKIYLTAAISDVSTAGQIYMTAPLAGTVTKISTVLNGAIATADAVLTAKDDAAASMGTVTIANAGSAAGDKDSLVPAANNVVAIGDSIEIETNGASTNTIAVFVLVEITPSVVDTD